MHPTKTPAVLHLNEQNSSIEEIKDYEREQTENKGGDQVIELQDQSQNRAQITYYLSDAN